MMFPSSVRPSVLASSLLHFILPFLLLVGFLFVGTFVQSWLGTWIPGSVIGMVLLSVALWTGAIRVSFLEPVSDRLLDNLGLFFVCPGVEVIKYLGLVELHWLSLVVAIVGSSVVTLVVTGWVGKKARGLRSSEI